MAGTLAGRRSDLAYDYVAVDSQSGRFEPGLLYPVIERRYEVPKPKVPGAATLPDDYVTWWKVVDGDGDEVWLREGRDRVSVKSVNGPPQANPTSALGAPRGESLMVGGASVLVWHNDGSPESFALMAYALLSFGASAEAVGVAIDSRRCWHVHDGSVQTDVVPGRYLVRNEGSRQVWSATPQEVGKE